MSNVINWTHAISLQYLIAKELPNVYLCQSIVDCFLLHFSESHFYPI